MESELFNCVNDLFMQKETLEEILKAVHSSKDIASPWEQVRETVKVWREQYLTGSATACLYGFLTWYLNIWVGKFCFPASHILKDSLIKMLVVSAWNDIDNDQFASGVSLGERLHSERDEWTECRSCTLLSHDLLIEDLERFYSGSHSRLENHLQKYKEHTDLNRGLVDADEKYRRLIACVKNNSQIEQIVRINRLGVYEDGYTYHSENALYFISVKQSLYLLEFCDFA